MNPEKLLNVIKQAREGAKKRNFTQSFDLIVHLKELDLKKPEQQIEFFLKFVKIHQTISWLFLFSYDDWDEAEEI